MVRFKYRYLVVEARQERASPQLSRDGLSDSIKASIQENFGDYGSGILLPTYQSTFQWHLMLTFCTLQSSSIATMYRQVLVMLALVTASEPS